ncbi:transcriptional regulator [Haloprofundus marisrubri]|uniref:Transcriptional regulator n=1 Tax=Haloprofundus marisrubri TaxID=1514971 RepID=A0A0W1R359_9EURY|nr:IclR family transcriptional regulator [Haloprofundus marisrubri]KTG07753.1 transcriptional regulator [Haloprofundus marisrubri]
MTQTNDPATVQAVRTMFDIVEYVAERDGVTITEVATDLGYAKSTIHRHFSTLHELGYIVETPTGYQVGLRFLEVGHTARVRQRGHRMVKEKVENIAAETGERAQFIVEEHGEGVYIHRAFGERAVRTDPGIGSRIPLHATSAGKAILASMDEKRSAELIEAINFDPITEFTITDSEQLYDELEAIRERGYSFNRQENLNGLHAVGVAVSGPDGEVIGALSVSGPSHRMQGTWFEEELPKLLLGTANELELNIAHS